MPKLDRVSMPKLSKTLLIVFACLTIISVLSIYYTHQLPTYETRTETLCTYQHNGSYHYVAKLKPNVLYNKTVLKPGEGTLYTALVEYINLTFIYTFNSSPKPQSIQVDHQTTVHIESPGRWPIRTLSQSEAQEIFQLSKNLNFTMQINCTKVKRFVETIDKEIYGTIRSTTYNIKITSEIHVKANLTTCFINETFTPQLTIAFKTDTEKGNYISIENLQQTKPGSILKTEQILSPGVQNLRAASIIATTITTIVLATSAIIYFKHKSPTPPIKAIEKFIAPYKDLIAKTAQKPPRTENTVKIETLEDLAKIAEILARPILLIKEPEPTLIVIDQNVIYEYRINLENL